MSQSIKGYIIVAFKKIRQASNIEIMNSLSTNQFDTDLYFYTQIHGQLLDAEDIRFKKADRIRKISSGYIKYYISYALEKKEIPNQINKMNVSQPDDHRPFDYIFIWNSENIIEDYKSFCMDIKELEYKRVKLSGYCKLKTLKNYLSDFETYGEVVKEF